MLKKYKQMAVRATFDALSNKSDDEELKGKWRVNFYFFFATASQAFLWAWIPEILKVSGLSKTNAGIALCFLNILFLVSIWITLQSLQKTRNGAFRRLSLFSLSVISMFFNIAGILIIPSSSEHALCFPVTVEDSLNRHEVPWNFSSTNFSTIKNTPSKEHYFNTNTFNYNSKDSKRKQTFKLTSVRNNSVIENVDGEKLTTVSHGSSSSPEFFTTTKSNHHKTVLDESTSNMARSKSFHKEATFPNVNFHVTTPSPSDFPIVSGDSNKYTIDERSHDFSKDVTHTTGETVTTHQSNTTTVNQTRDSNEKTNNEYYKINHFKHHQKYEKNRTRLENYKSYLTSTVRPENKKSKLGHTDNTYFYNIEQPNLSKNRSSISKFLARNNTRQNHTDIEKFFNYHKYFPQDSFQSRNDNPYLTNSFSKQDSYLFRKKRGISNSTHDKETDQSKIGWAIFTLLAIGTLLGGGIEASVSKLWYCYKYGVPEEKGPVDVIEATISPMFRLCVLDDHRYWSLLSTSLWITIPTVFIGLGCHLGMVIYSPFTLLGGFHLIFGIVSWIAVLIVPIPYGSLQQTKHRHPLSLYLDDEVLKEGLRRVGFHVWVSAFGFILALPTFYTLWLLDETSNNTIEVFVAQTASIIVYFFGEGVTYFAEKWISRKLNIPGLMIIAGFLVLSQNIVALLVSSLRVQSGSLLFIGYSTALIWIASRNNSLLLATTYDQEKECWMSWSCFKIGNALGAVVWATLSDTDWAHHSVRHLFITSAIICSLSTFAVILVGIFMRSKGQKRRRIYHTLDLHMARSDDESDELTTPEDDVESDWLVKRAKKEGITL